MPCEGLSKDVFEAAFPYYDEYDGTAYIFRDGGLGRKTKFVPGLTDYLKEIIEEDGQAELQCHFCLKKYQFDKDELIAILEEMS